MSSIQGSEHDSETVKPTSAEDDIIQLFENELKEYPQVYKFIQKLQEMVERQRKLLQKYHEKFKQLKKEVQHIGIQTDTNDILQQSMPTDDKGAIDINSFKEEIVQAAHSAVQKSGFVFEPVSGLYYDYNTGYYYNSELGLYYDGNTSSYYYFNEQENKFEFHSQVQAPTNQQSANNSSDKVGASKKSHKDLKSGPKGFNSEPSGLSQSTVTPLPDSDMLSDVSSNSDLCGDPETVIKEEKDTDSPQKHTKIGGSEGSDSQEKEDGELSSDEEVPMDTVTMDTAPSRDATGDTDTAATSKYRTPLEYYNSEEYRTWYESYVQSVTVQYHKTPVAYDPASEEAKSVNPALKTEEYEIAHAWPPCLRIIVTETAVKGLTVGTLFLVTYLGGTVGREGEHAVLIPDINISKHHAKITFTGSETHKEDSSKGYTLVDLGSRNGTYANGIRLSAALQESEPHLLKHGTELRIGSTKLSVHIHQGHDTCDQCEPGVLMGVKSKSPSVKIDLSTTSDQNRQAEVRRLRKKFGLDKTAAKPAVCGYADRAERRRQTVGSQVEGEKTQVATMEERLADDNKGFRMLSKMGWRSGQTLGRDEANASALVEPIIPQQYAKNAGLGCSMPGSVFTPNCPNTQRKKTVWAKTQARFNVLGDEPPPISPPDGED